MPIRRCSTPGARSIAAAFICLVLSCLLSVAGCGTNAGTVPVPPPTVSIAANPATVTAGASSMLTVTAANATTLTVQGTDGSSYTLPATGGTQSVTPAATTTYTAVVTAMNGSAKAQTTVTVSAQTAPTVSIVANPASITAGNASTLTVTATGANTVTVQGTDGSSYTLAAAGGTQSVSPTATTTYTATANGPGGTATATAMVTVSAQAAPTVSMTTNPTTITAGNSSTLTVTATNANAVTVTGTDGSSYTLAATGGTQSVSPTATTTYTATANGPGGSTTATAIVTVTPSAGLDSIDHVIFMMQENRTFDSYFGMLNPYRQSNGFTQGADGNTYAVDGIDDKLSKSNTNDEGQVFNLFKFKTTCIDDASSAWLESYGDVNTYDFAANRPILMDGFVHTAEGYAKSCAASGACSGQFTDTAGQRAMGYYDQGFLNYYYYMASQFALSDRWFTPVSTYTTDNRIATITGGTTQGLVFAPGNDGLPQLNISSIFEELDQNNVSWKLYYTVTQGFCTDPDDCTDPGSKLPATDFLALSYSTKYVYENPSGAQCVAPTQPSSVVGDSTNSYCIDPSHIAPLSQFFTDMSNNALASFVWIDPGFGNNDEHPGSGQSNLVGQAQVASILNAFMASPEWKDSVFFLAYDEGGGPYDHVPPVPGHSNDNTDSMVGGAAVTSIPDISSIAVNADSYNPCVPANGTPTLHCDLNSNDPGAVSTDAPAVSGFAAQLGFRVPNMVISPFTRAHYVSHIPMDHTAIIKFVENRFIGSSVHLTARDAAQPNLLDFFDFNNIPWATPPSPPTPVSASSLGYDPCTPTSMGP
ncbi:MAG: alkaline phosphatase family protein [Acidobacteriaceae bacterium]